MNNLKDEVQQRIEQMYQTKRADIKFLNALNNATQIVSAMLPKGFKNCTAISKEIRMWADWYNEQYALRRVGKKTKPLAKKISKKNLQKLLKSARGKVKNDKH